MKQFLRYTLTLVAILIATSNAWAQNLQYQWVERFSGTTTFDNADLKKITDGEYTNNVKFSISDVSYYYNYKLIGDGDYLLKYAKQSKNSTKTSTFSWTAKDNTYNIIVTKIEANIRGYQAKLSTKTASAYFTNGESITCNTNSTGEGGSKNISVTNNSGLGNSTTLTMTTGANDTEFTLHNIRYTYKVTQRVPEFQYKAIAVTNNSEYGSAYSSWSSFANATTSESTHTKYDPNTLSTTPGIAQTVYFKAVPKTGYNFVGWKKSLDATTYESYDMEYSLDFTSTSNDKDKPSTITLYAVFNAQKDPRFDIQTTAAVEVGKTIYPTFTFDDVANAPTSDTSKKFHFIITHTPDATTKEGSDDPSKVISYNPTDNSITGLNSGTAKITFIHEETNDYFGQTQECVVTVSKQQTSLSLNLQETYFVDDEDNTVYTTNHSDVTVLVSDKTSDNRALFTYSNGILKANGDTLNADSETTTITVTQPENYKWTSYTQEKNVTVKKYHTYFNWLLQDTYFVGETITSIFNKSANGLPSTIISSDPTIVKVENNQLIALRAGKVEITVSQHVNRKWTAFRETKEITIVKRNTNFKLLLGKTYYVDDQIADAQIYSKVNENTLPISITSSDTTVLEYDAANHKLIAHNAGKATICVSQAKDTTWTDFNQSLEITVLKHNIVATITPDNAVWNEQVLNPFAATSKHPVSGQETKIDNFNVEQQDNEHIALMDATTRDIQTYYTNGTVDFRITRREDRKYNALNQTLTLTVNASTESCDINLSATNVETGTRDYSTSGTITLNGEGDILSFSYRLNDDANVAHYLTTQYSTTDTGDNFQDIANSRVGEQDQTLLSHSLTLPTGTKRIRFTRTDDGLGYKKFVISNITVTRKQYLSITLPEVNNDTLFLPTVAINQPSTDTFNLAWSACSESILLVCDNSKFTIQPSVIQNADRSGNQTITVSCDPSELGTFTGKIFIYNQAQKDSIYVSCTINRKWTPIFSGTKAYNMQVDSTLTADFTYKDTYPGYPSEDPQAPFYYTIKHILDPNNHVLKAAYADKVITYDPITKQITAHNAGTAILALIQREIEPMADADGYFTDTLFCTITVSKRHTYFDIKTITQCKTGDVFPYASIFNVFTNNSDVTMTFTSGDESVIKYEDSKLKALCAGSTSFTVAQAESYKWFGLSQTLNINVKKYNSNFSLTNNGADITCLIGDKIDALSLYTTANNEILPTIESNNPEVVSFNPTTRQLEAKKAGEAIITISQLADCKWTDYTTTCKVIVEKHTPVFTWEDPVYFNSTVIDYFSTNNTATAITITQPSTDTDVAELYFSKTNATDLHTLDLTTYAKESSTTVTISQEENWYWYAKTETHTITPIDPNNHVTFTIDSQERRDIFDVNWNANPYTWDNGIQMGDWLDGFDWKDKYVDIHFTGIPDKLGFSTSVKNAGMYDVSDVYWYVKESVNGDNWSDEIWNQKDTKNITITGDSIQLDPDTRYIRLCYSGNFGGVFHNITVTELNQFEARPDTLDFGTQYVDNPDTTKTFDFHYANAGYKVQLLSTDSLHFTVSTTYIDTIGGEKYGTVKDIQVTYHPTEVHNTVDTDAKILIWDEIGNQDTVFLVANTIKSKPTLYWTKDWSAKEPIVILNQHMPDTVAKSTNGYKVKYRSDDESILKIAPDSLSFIAVGIGETYITAHADSDRVYLAPDTIRKLFHVTDKQMQYIVWEDNLTDLCIGDNPIPLTAQVWVMTDAANNTWEYSPKQTAKLQYTSPNTSVVSVTNNTLYIHGKGELLLEASVPADSTYEMAKAQVPVRVYDCSIACTDADLVIPIVGMQLEDELHFDPYQTWDNEKIVEIDTSKGIPGNLTFTYRGVKEWTVLEGKIRVFESTDGGNTWNQVLSDADAVTPEDNTTQYSPLIPLSPNATHIKFERFPNNFSSVRYGSHYVQFITVLPAHYIKTVPDDIHFGNVYVGNSIDTTINVLYSSIRSDLQLAVSENHLSIDKTTIIDECGAWDTVPLKVSLRADAQIVGAYHQYVTIKDPLGEITDTIHVYANIVKNSPTITWETTLDTIRSSAEWETQKTAFASSGDQVHYELTAGNQHAYLNDAGKMILLRGGRITARAYTEETTTSNEVSAYHNFYIIVDPLFEDFDNDSTWNNDNNWNIGRTPWATDSATIKANKHVQLTTEVTIDGIQFEAGSSIHITHTGGLTINEQGVTNADSVGSSITIDNKPQGAGFLRISPSAPEANKYPHFTMNFTTRAFNEGVPRDETWQYMGAPGNNATFKDPFKDLESQTLIYHWDETKGWTPYTVTDTIPTWQGYALTQSIDTNQTYQITAQAIQGTDTIDLTYTASGMKGDNLFVNSFTAPIDITKIDTTDVTGNWSHQTFYFFNTGSWNDWQGTNPNHSHDDASSAGHYYAVPLFSAPYLEGSQTIVPPMQGVYVHTDTAGVSIKLDYEKHVWNGAAGNLPMRAPQKQSPDFRRVRIQVSSDNSGADRMYIIQKPSTTRDYDNGYDGKNINAKGQVNIYTNEPFGKMEVSCANNIDSMYIGLRTGSDTHYTLTFGAVAGDSLYLQDLENDSIIPIFDDEQYHFTAEPNAVNNNRFLLLSRPYKAPNGETSTPETDGDELTKIWSVGKVIYIANAPANSVATLYTVGGHLVLSTPIANTQSPTILDVSYLPEGVYILRLNDQVYKFVCK